MDKKTLRQIPRPETKPEYIDLARNTQAVSWLLQVSEADGIMQVIAWDAAGMRADEESKAKYRFFIGEDDYITQDLTKEKTKSLTGKMSSILHMGWWNNKWLSTMFVDTQSRELFERRFPPKSRSWWNNSEETPFISIEDWQDAVLKERLNARYERELAHTRQMMELVPNLPEDFDTWVHDYGMRSRRYLVYDGNNRIRIREAFCTECGQHMEIDSKKVRLRMNEWGECPCCGSPVYMKTIKRWHYRERATNDIVIVQKLDDGKLLFRCFSVTYSFEKQEFPLLRITKEMSVFEHGRVFINGHQWESFEYAEYKQNRKSRWCPDTGKVGINAYIIRRDGLRKLLAGTPYQYSGIEVLQEKIEFAHFNVFDYLRAYERCPELEMLVKYGLKKLATEWVHDVMFWHRKGLPEGLKELTKPHLKMLRDLDGGKSMISLIREIELCKKDVSDADLKEFIEVFGSSAQVLRMIFLHEMSVRKFTRYVRKQTPLRKDPTSRANFIHDWKDYMAWCEELGYNLADDYVRMPPNFKKAHDRVLKELNDQRDADVQRAMDEINRIFAEQMESMQKEAGSNAVLVKSKKFMFVVPKSAEDLKREGQTLHHCVATYADRVARKETMIIFVRKVEAPEEPFFTMEWRDNRVIQCRGSHNCGMPQDVKAFVTAFEKQMQKKHEKQIPRLKVRAG